MKIPWLVTKSAYGGEEEEEPTVLLDSAAARLVKIKIPHANTWVVPNAHLTHKENS